MDPLFSATGISKSGSWHSEINIGRNSMFCTNAEPANEYTKYRQGTLSQYVGEREPLSAIFFQIPGPRELLSTWYSEEAAWTGPAGSSVCPQKAREATSSTRFLMDSVDSGSVSWRREAGVVGWGGSSIYLFQFQKELREKDVTLARPEVVQQRLKS